MLLALLFSLMAGAMAPRAESADGATRIDVGVLAYAGKETAEDRWQATADYLSERNPGYRFVVRPLFLSELHSAFVQGRLDFVLTQPLQFTELKRAGSIWPLATQVTKGNGQELERLGAVIFTHEGSGMASLEDLAGRRVAGTSPNALGGWLLGMQALDNAGLEVDHQITPIFTGLPLEAVLDAVLDGRADAGVVRASFFQRYLEAHPDSGLVPVGAAERKDFPYPSNTPLVPEWPFAATERAPEGLTVRVADQLLELPADVASRAGIAGWRTPLDYSSVDRLHGQWLTDPVTAGSLLRHSWQYLVLILTAVLALFTWQARRATRRLGLEKRRLGRAFSGLHTGAVLTDASGRILLTNPAGEGFARNGLEGRLPGRSFCEVFDFEVEHLSPQCAFDVLVEGLDTHETRSLDGVIERDNQRLDVNLRISRLEAEGGTQVLVSMLDVTDLRSANALLTYRATHDRLTGVLNREAMEEFLSQAMPGKAPPGEPVHASCLVWTDLDDFRLLNEIGTRDLGDRILASLASHLSLELPSDAVLARMGVDEFAIWMPLASRDTCAPVAREVLEVIHAFRLPDEHEHLRLKASIGVTRIESDDLVASKRLEDAERACQSARRLGGDRVVQYSGEDTELQEREQQIERYNALRGAIAENRLELASQRIVPLDPDATMIHEVLLRVTDAEGVLRFPGEYIEIAEKHHAMGEIDRWVIRHGCRWLARQPVESGTASINLSAHSVQDPEMIDFIRQELGQSGVDPGRVVFEITETAAILNLDQAERLIGAMRRNGCRFALDDFGGGFLSFEYLRRLDPDIVKIDGRLVDDLSRDPVAAVIVSAIVQVCHVMGARTVAEWVETDEQYRQVVDMGVDYVQGFLLHRPTALDRA